MIVSVALTIIPIGNTQSLPLGSMAVSQTIFACSGARNGSQFYPNMQCQNAVITCPNTAGIQLTFGTIAPANPKGTIVFFSGGKGTTPTESGDDILQYAANYAQKYQVVQVEWASAWEDPSSDGSGGNVLTAACRPATFLNAILTPAQGAKCAQGASAGAAAIAYSMAWYGTQLTNVELTSGPTLSEIDQGCAWPNASTPTLCGAGSTYCSPKTVSWTDKVIYVPNYNADVSSWTGIPACATSGVNSANYPAWAAMSLVDGVSAGATPVFSYPGTGKHAWVCQSYSTCNAPSCPNNSASEGKFLYDAVSSAEGITSNLVVTGVQSCDGEEGVAQGTDPDSNLPAPQAIENDMLSKCVAP